MLTQSLTRSFVHLLTCSLAHSIAPTRLDASISSLSSPGVLSPKHHTPGQQRQQQRLINAHVFSFSASNAIHSTHSRNPKTKSISPPPITMRIIALLCRRRALLIARLLLSARVVMVSLALLPVPVLRVVVIDRRRRERLLACPDFGFVGGHGG
ncbi:hypothetical protein IWX46DRAFT_139162 [Phyllosticta citricarpa]|uniref:Secreted protein n=1 Tax=Phyllosticta citricarpa TaxID=55181 RepID=A0ABR1MPT6_9PEZI